MHESSSMLPSDCRLTKFGDPMIHRIILERALGGGLQPRQQAEEHKVKGLKDSGHIGQCENIDQEGLECPIALIRENSLDPLYQAKRLTETLRLATR
jgi:hypothetical protein